MSLLSKAKRGGDVIKNRSPAPSLRSRFLKLKGTEYPPPKLETSKKKSIFETLLFLNPGKMHQSIKASMGEADSTS